MPGPRDNENNNLDTIEEVDEILEGAEVIYTREQKLEAIREVNKGMVKAGIKPMTEAEMEALADDKVREEEYNAYYGLAQKIERTYFFNKNSTFKVPGLFARSSGYIFNLENTKEAAIENKKLEERLSTEEGVRSFVLELYNKAMAIDEASLYMDTKEQKIAFFNEDTQFRQMLMEFEHIFKDGQRLYEPSILTDKQYQKLQEKLTLLCIPSVYEAEIRMKGSPLYLSHPDMGTKEYPLMTRYYYGDDEKVDFILRAMNVNHHKEYEKYATTAVEILKEQGFIGKTEENVSYEVYNAKGKKLTGRAAGIEKVLTGETDSIRIVKIVEKEGQNADAENITLVLDKEMVVKRYDIEHFSVRFEAACSKYPAITNIQFSDDSVIADAQKAVLLYRLDKSKILNGETTDASKNREIARISSSITNKDDAILSYIVSQSSDVAKQMTEEMISSNPSMHEGLRKLSERMDRAQQHMKDATRPGEDFIASTLAPKVNSNVAVLEVSESTSTKVVESKTLSAAQSEIEQIELHAPEGLSDEDVATITFAHLFTRENMAESCNKTTELGNTKRNAAATYVLEPALTGASTLFEDSFANDSRENTQLVRLLVPDARRKAQNTLQEIANGQYENAAKSAHDALKFAVSVYRSYEYGTQARSLGAARMVVALNKFLDKPEIRGLVQLTDEEKNFVKLAETDMKLAKEMAEYEQQIYNRADQLNVAKKYLDMDMNLNLAEDEELRKAYIEYEARALYFKRATVSSQAYTTAARIYNDTREGQDAAKYSRPLNRVQKNMIADPDAYLNHIKEEISNPNHAVSKAFGEAKNYDEVGELVRNSAAIEDDEQLTNIPYIEKWDIGKRFKIALTELENKPEYADLYNEIKELPCLKDENDFREITSAEQIRRANLYKQVAEKISTTGFRKTFIDDVGTEYVEYSSTQIAEWIDDKANKMLANADFAESERTFERSLIMRNQVKPEPKTNGSLQRAKNITKVRTAWTVRGNAIKDFLPDNGQDENNFKALEDAINAHKYGNGREEVGAFLCMCMLGQQESDGSPKYSINDIITPGKLVEEKRALYSKLMNIDDIKSIDDMLKKGVERSCNYLSGVMGTSLIAENLSAVISPEAATVAHLANIIFHNNAKSSYNEGKLLEDSPVYRLKQSGLDLRETVKSYGGMVELITTTTASLLPITRYVEEGKVASSFVGGLANYIAFDSALKKSRDKDFEEMSDIIPSTTTPEFIHNLLTGEGPYIRHLTDITPVEYSGQIVDDYMNMSDDDNLDVLIEDRKVDEFFEDNSDDEKIQEKKEFVESYRPYLENVKDDVYRYGIAAMYLKGNLFKNVQYSAEPFIDNTRQISYANISIRFDKTLERANVLREAYLSDLDAAEFHFDPIVEAENGELIPDINQARTESLRQFKQSLDDLNPSWGSSPEWKNMKAALDRALTLSEKYEIDYEAIQNNPEPNVSKEALEELNSAMEIVRATARKYVEHKVDRVDFKEGADFNRLKAAKRLENFGRNQGDYLTAKLANEVTNTLDKETELHIESVYSDAAAIRRLKSELKRLYEETHSHSAELDDLMDSLDELREVQNSIEKNRKIDEKDNRRYYGITTVKDGHIDGAIDKVIEKAQKYIDHRITEGLTKDRYTKRVDMALRIKNYLEVVRENAERTQNKRLEAYKNDDAKSLNHEAFNDRYGYTKSALVQMWKNARDENIPDNDKPRVKGLLYNMLAHQKYVNDRELIRNGKLDASQSEIVKFVEAGDFIAASEFMKANAEVNEFVESHSNSIWDVKKYSNDMECANALSIIENRAAKRKTVEQCVEDAGKITDGNMDKTLLAKYIVSKSVLEAAKSSGGPTQENTAALINKTQDSKELEAVINRYQGTKDFAAKMEAMYLDYAQLAVFTKQHEGKMPENVDEYLDAAKTNKISIAKAGNEPVNENKAVNENKPQVEAKAEVKKPEEIKPIQ